MDITAPSELSVDETTNGRSELEDWVAPLSPIPHKGPSSRLLFLAVEYSDTALDFANGTSYSTFEAGALFCPQATTSLSEFEEHVSNFDPNLNSAARYSQVYGSLDVSTTEEELSEALQSQATQSEQYNQVESLSHPIRLMDQFQRMGRPVVVIQESTNAPEAEETMKVVESSDETNCVLANIASVMFANRSGGGGGGTEDDLQMVAFDEEMADGGSSIDLLLAESDDESQMEQLVNEPKCSEADSVSPENSNNVQTITDKPVALRSRATLPAPYLVISKTQQESGERSGVFARRMIPKQTRFGPVEGILSKADAVGDPNSLHLIVEDETGNLLELDISDENRCNWMRFVGCARNQEEQNLALHQHGNSLYYTTTRSILPGQELLVWYSQPYALKRGLPTLLQVPPQLATGGDADMTKLSGDGIVPNQEFSLSWTCFLCDEQFLSSMQLQKHINSHKGEVGAVWTKPCERSKSGRQLKWNTLLQKMTLEKMEKISSAYQCGIRRRRFPGSYFLRRHQLIHGTAIGKSRCQTTALHVSGHRRKQHGHRPKRKQAWKSYLGDDVSTEASDYVDAVIVFAESEEASVAASVRPITSKCRTTRARKMRGLVNPAKPCKCELCYKAFATEDRLQRHMLVHGAEDSKPLQCLICFKRFLNNSALSCHVKVHTEKKMFECPICKVTFDQILPLKEHVQIHARDGMFSCPHCPKEFDEYSLIRKHIRGFHSDRKHDCPCCKKLFPTLDKLRLHMLRHSDHREFLCANCGKQFKRKDKLKEHMKRMHSVEREQRVVCRPARLQANKKYIPKVQVSPQDYNRFIYKCHMCLLGFKRRGMLVNHLAKRHPDVSPESVPELNLPILKTTRDYYCQYCEKVYKSSSKRKAHILKNHPGAELPMSNRRKGGVPVIPGLPNPTFSQTVGSVTTCPHGCPWCHKQYASKAKLLQHQRKKHTNLITNVGSQVAQELQSSIESMESVAECSDHTTVHSITILSNNFQSKLDQLTIPIEAMDKSTDESDAASPSSHIKVFGVGTDLLTQAMSELSQSLGREFPSVTAEQYQQLLAAAEYTPH